MFKPDSTFKRIAKNHRTCGYVYKDGVSLIEHVELSNGKYTKDVDVNHFWPCEIRLVSHNYGGNELKCKRIVFHNPTLLLAGINQVVVAYNNSSQASKERGIMVDSMELETLNGMRINVDVIPFYSSDICIQPGDHNGYYGNDPEDSIQDLIKYLKDHYENVEIHDTKPEKESIS